VHVSAHIAFGAEHVPARGGGEGPVSDGRCYRTSVA
jgi:hypothetical protein